MSKSCRSQNKFLELATIKAAKGELCSMARIEIFVEIGDLAAQKTTGRDKKIIILLFLTPSKLTIKRVYPASRASFNLKNRSRLFSQGKTRVS